MTKRRRASRGGLARGCVVVLAALAAAGAAGATAPGAAAYETAAGVAAEDFATGFASQEGIGPVGVAFDAAGNLYAAAGDTVYRFGPGGGTADPSTALNARPLAGRLTGLAFGRDGRLYAARRTGASSGDVFELDQDSGAVVRVVADQLPCPTALATDPRSGDLFVSTGGCGSGVLRLTRPAAGRARVYVYVSGLAADGLTFGRDGTLFVAHAPVADGTTVSEVAGTQSAQPGSVRGLAAVAGADGISLGMPAAGEHDPPFLVVNRQDGTITRIDLGPAHTRTDLVTGGTRGDLSAVGPDGCLYATQSEAIVRVRSASRPCVRPGDPPRSGEGAAGSGGPLGDGAPLGDAGPLGGGLVPTSPPIEPPAARFLKAAFSSGCGARRSVTLRFRAPGGVALRSARVLRAGRLVRRLGAGALRGPVVLRSLPRGAFTLKVVGVTSHGRRVTLRRRVGACRR